MDSSQQVLRLGLEHRPGQPTGTIRLTLCHALVIVGLFPWLLVNAVYTQLPSFIATLPEGAHIASRIIVSVSVGNLLMLIFVLSTKVGHDGYWITYRYSIPSVVVSII